MIYLGPVPASEDCAQVGSENYTQLAKLECKRYIKQLKKQFGEPPEGCTLRVKSEFHDYGAYHEVVCDYNSKEGAAFALKCEGEAWDTWLENEAHKWLRKAMEGNDIELLRLLIQLDDEPTLAKAVELYANAMNK